MDKKMITPSEGLLGYKVVNYMGTVNGHCIKGSIGKINYQDALDGAINAMAANAIALGANAIISVRIQSLQIAPTQADFFVYGSAIVVEPIS
jgi:uncharacterized protein YbjQ (UPF0145 family)